MREYDRGCVGEDGDLEHLPRLDDGGSQAADADLSQTEDRVTAIQEHHDELLPILVAKVFL